MISEVNLLPPAGAIRPAILDYKYEPGGVLGTPESLFCHNMVGDNECEGLKKKRIGQSAAKPCLKKPESSTTRESNLKVYYS
jgi:hypothetical protein